MIWSKECANSGEWGGDCAVAKAVGEGAKKVRGYGERYANGESRSQFSPARILNARIPNARIARVYCILNFK